MHFIEFIKSLPKQKDKRVQSFIDLVSKDKKFPSASNPSELAIYLYKTLDEDMTRGYQFCLMMYSQDSKNELPKFCFTSKDMMLHAINLIVTLQNFDSD